MRLIKSHATDSRGLCAAPTSTPNAAKEAYRGKDTETDAETRAFKWFMAVRHLDAEEVSPARARRRKEDAGREL